MNAVSSVPTLVITLCSLGFAAAMAPRTARSPVAEMRFATIDGLRGFLALAVFLHHSAIWYFYLRGAAWELPPSRLYTHLGESSVVIFFMITGLLFTAKLRDASDSPIDWLRVYVGRVLRLVPLYALSMLALVAIVVVATNGVVSVSVRSLVSSITKWMTFTLLGAPDINGFSETSMVVAGVTWSLRYEWLFYLALPLLALCVRTRTSKIAVAVSLLATCLLWTRGFSLVHVMSLMGGVAASYLVTLPGFSGFARHKYASVLPLLLGGISVTLSPTAYQPTALLCLFVAFALVTAGCSIFGLLHSACAKSLGEATYGIYLLYGILLYVCFRFVIGMERAAQLTAAEHWAAVFLVAMVLVPISHLSFRYVEQPGMRLTEPVTNWTRTRVDAVVRPIRVQLNAWRAYGLRGARHTTATHLGNSR